MTCVDYICNTQNLSIHNYRKCQTYPEMLKRWLTLISLESDPSANQNKPSAVRRCFGNLAQPKKTYSRQPTFECMPKLHLHVPALNIPGPKVGFYPSPNKKVIVFQWFPHFSETFGPTSSISSSSSLTSAFSSLCFCLRFTSGSWQNDHAGVSKLRSPFHSMVYHLYR